MQPLGRGRRHEAEDGHGCVVCVLSSVTLGARGDHGILVPTMI